jgi:hypothetical protein
MVAAMLGGQRADGAAGLHFDPGSVDRRPAVQGLANAPLCAPWKGLEASPLKTTPKRAGESHALGQDPALRLWSRRNQRESSYAGI